MWFIFVNYVCIYYNSGTLGSGLCVCKFVALVKGSGVCAVPTSVYNGIFPGMFTGFKVK